MTPYEEAQKAVDALRAHVDQLEREARKLVGKMAQLQAINTAEAIGFLKEPWCILPKSRDEIRTV